MMHACARDCAQGAGSSKQSRGSVDSSLGREPLLSRRARGRPAAVLSALRFGLMLGTLAGFAFPPGAMMAHAAVPESQQQQPARAVASPGSLSTLPKTCLESDRANGNVTHLLNAIRDHPTADAWNALGVLYAQRNLLTCAIPAFETALGLQPDSAEARYNLALALIKGGRTIQATQELQTLIRQKPQFAGAHLALGVVLQGEGKLGAAESEFEAAIKSDPHFYAAYLNLAGLLESEKRYPAAVSSLQQALAFNPPQDVADQLQTALGKARAQLGQPENPHPTASKPRSNPDAAAGALNNEANKLLADGKVHQAADTYREALRLSPNNALFHYNLSLALDKLGNRNEEEQELEEAVKLDPKLGVAHDQLGLLALQGGKLDKASQELRKALILIPRDAETQDNLGVLYSMQGNDAQAVTLFQQSIQSDIKYAKAYTDLGLMEAKHGEYAEAERQFQTAIKLAPDNESGYTALGMLQAKTGREPDAIQNFRKAVALVPGSPDAHVNLGIALADQYDLAGGLAQFSEAIRLAPHFAKAHYNLGRFYFYTGKYDEARKELETACQIQPDYADALYSLALTERQLDSAGRATELLEKVVALSPGNADAQYLLGQNLLQMGKTDEAIAHWKAAVSVDPNQSQSLYNLARTLDKRHDPEAEQYMERFRRLEKSQRLFDRVQALGNFALEAANAQNWPQAVEQMKEAIQLCGQCAESAHLHRNLGLIYCRTGNRQDGEQELQVALQLDPHDEDAKKALAQLANLPPAPQN